MFWRSVVCFSDVLRCVVVFFFKQKTAYEMRISDWSSDVCSSDLLICHLPLVVPDGCGLRVGAETRSWREGELLIFDDSFEHEAWNRGTSDRTILLFEIWRPDIEDRKSTRLNSSH